MPGVVTVTAGDAPPEAVMLPVRPLPATPVRVPVFGASKLFRFNWLGPRSTLPPRTSRPPTPLGLELAFTPVTVATTLTWFGTLVQTPPPV